MADLELEPTQKKKHFFLKAKLSSTIHQVFLQEYSILKLDFGLSSSTYVALLKGASSTLRAVCDRSLWK